MTKTITVRDFAGIKDVTLHPTGNLVVIAGDNGAGKSSLINAVAELFNSKGVKLFPKPIREGADEAYAEYVDEELGMRISRSWKKNDSGKLDVSALDGARYSRPSEVVASLTGGLLFDPIEFLNLDERKQREALLAKVVLPFDLDELARAKAGAEDRRRDAGREVKRLQGALASLPEAPEGTPDAEVSAGDLLARIQTAQDIDRRAAEHERRVTDAEDRIHRLEQDLASAKEYLRQLEMEASEIPAQDDDVDALRAELSRVDEINKAVRAKAARAATAAELALAEAAQATEQEALDAIERTKRDGLAQAEFPIPGLSVDENGVTFNGIPFSQVNSAHKMRAAFGIATAGDPQLKLVIVRNGDLLDAESLDALAQIAEERGYTALVERDRDESRQIGFTIKDGELA